MLGIQDARPKFLYSSSKCPPNAAEGDNDHILMSYTF